MFLLVLAGGGFAHAADSRSAEGDRWEILRAQLFEDRVVNEGEAIIRVTAPGRAFDAARVPVTVHATRSLPEDRYIHKLYIVVDNNPLPVAGTFTFEPNNGWDTVNTELRINEYSHLRVIAELDDGTLHMTKSFVKAVGGCSAPPSSYDRSDATLLGSFKGGINEFLNPAAPAVATVRVVHPNASGMQFDQYTRTYIQPHYIHTMGAEFNGRTLFTLETNFSLSQDPVLGFNFSPEEDGQLTIYALDSKDSRFEQSWDLKSSNL
ncbi:quinoprotein dehydrogenase-associated SoxYZ-like carrier [Chromatiales bacterium (ex Bugula neritina AB1)]|nr:quinoprotein dehydrogenase-associated SoxYZ-like carrier [Chromatiales bacterium (ex Bugula neritina AB1)]